MGEKSAWAQAAAKLLEEVPIGEDGEDETTRGLKAAADKALQRSNVEASLKEAAAAMAASWRGPVEESKRPMSPEDVFERSTEAMSDALSTEAMSDAFERSTEVATVAAVRRADPLMAAAEAVEKREIDEAAEALAARQRDPLMAAAEAVEKREIDEAAEALAARQRDPLMAAAEAVEKREIDEAAEALAASTKKTDTNDALAAAAAVVALSEATRQPQEEMPEPALSRTVSWARGDAVEVYVKRAKKWVGAKVLGESGSRAGTYDVRYDDGSGIERSVAPTLIRGIKAKKNQSSLEVPVASEEEEEEEDEEEEEEDEEEEEEEKTQERASASSPQPGRSLESGWRRGDCVEVRDSEGRWQRGVVTAGSDRNEIEIDVDGATRRFPESKVRPRPEAFARATEASANLLRECGDSVSDRASLVAVLEKNYGVSFDEKRRAPRYEVNETTERTKGELVEVRVCATSPWVVVVSRVVQKTSSLRLGDEILAIDGVQTADLVRDELSEEDADTTAETVARAVRSKCRSAFSIKVRRIHVSALSRREVDALALTYPVYQDAAKGGDAEFAVVVDECRKRLSQADGKSTRTLKKDPDGCFARVQKGCHAGFDALPSTALSRYLQTTPLPLYGPGRGYGGPSDDGAADPTRTMASSQAQTLVATFLDVSNDGVVSKDELADFVFGPPRTLNELKKALLEAAEVSGGVDHLFNALDTDGNGVLGKAELGTGLLRLGVSLLPAETDVLIRALDTDRDGCSGLDELAAFLGLSAAAGVQRTSPSAPRRRKPTQEQSQEETLRRPKSPLPPRPDPEASARRAVEMYATRCLALEDANLRLKKTVKHLREKKKTPDLSPHLVERLVPASAWDDDDLRRGLSERSFGDLGAILAARALDAARDAARCSRNRALTAKISVLEAANAAEKLANRLRVDRLEKRLEAKDAVNVELRARCNAAEAAARSRRNTPLSPRVYEAPPEPPQPRRDLDLERRTTALSAENDKLKAQLRDARDRERSAVVAWRAAAAREDSCRKSLVEVERDCQIQMREARRTVEIALRRAAFCETRLDETLAALSSCGGSSPRALSKKPAAA